MLHAGLDLSRHRLDVRVLEPNGATVVALAVAPDVIGPDGRAGTPQSVRRCWRWHLWKGGAFQIDARPAPKRNCDECDLCSERQPDLQA